MRSEIKIIEREKYGKFEDEHIHLIKTGSLMGNFALYSKLMNSA